MKRGVLIVLFILLIIPLVNSLDLNLTLNQIQYGPLQQFNGNLNITSVSNSYSLTPIIIKINNNETTRIPLKEILDINSISYSLNDSYYETTTSSNSLTKNFDGRGSYLFGVKIKNPISSASLDITGTANSGILPKDVILDIGNDNNPEYQYAGNFISWSNAVYQKGVSENNIANDRAIITTSKTCEDINITLNELVNETLINITAFVTKMNDGGNLTASLDNIAECKLPEPGATLTKVSCSVKLANPTSGTHNVCLYSKSNVNKDYYKVPFFDFGNSFSYYYSLRYANYDTELNTKTIFSNNKLVDSLNNYLNNCVLDDSNFCIIPINLSTSSKGTITLDNLDIREGNIQRTTLYNVNFVPEKINFDYAFISLDTITSLVTPTPVGKYTLTFNLNNKETSQEFNITKLPEVSITSKNFALENEEIQFKGSSDSVIVEWLWDFGDNSTSLVKETTHSYNTPGNYTIKLSVKTINNVKNSVTKTIYIGALESNLGNIIDSIKNTITKTKTSLSNQVRTAKDLYDIYKDSFDSAISELNNLKNEYLETVNSTLSESERESKYEEIFNEVIEIQDSTPKSFFVTKSFQTNAKVSNIDDINPEIINLPSTIDYKNSVYEFNQKNVVIATNAYEVKIKYLSNKDDTKILVKKQISINSGNNLIVLEDLDRLANICSNSCNPEDAIFSNNNFEIVNNNAAKFTNVNDNIEYSYLLPEGELNEILKTKTIVFEEPEFTTRCGDNTCDSPVEDSNWCPQDCKKSSSIWLILIPLFIGVLLLTYFFSKGKIHVKDIFKPKNFKNKVQEMVLKNYIESSMKRGMSEQETRQKLLVKGWTKEQIDQAFKRKA